MKTMRTSLRLLIITLSLLPTIFAQKNQSDSPTNIQTLLFRNFSANSLNATISNDGVFGDYRQTNSSGLEWPKGSNRRPVYSSGLWVVGKHRPSSALRTALMMYSSEYQPGKILSTFNTSTNVSTADNSADQLYHVYKINKGDVLNGGNTDYDQWPAHLGAPFVDVNGNGSWEKGIDDPLKWGDQLLWTVANDADYVTHKNTGVTQPMGIEVQSSFFGYDRSGVLGNTVIMRYKIINKSDADYDSVFISYWSDTDLGDANDDLVGVDTLLAAGYYYNGDDNDAGSSGYGTFPPAGGFVLLQGPMVKTNNPSDTARYEGKKRAGSVNLRPYAHTVFFGGDPMYADPPLGSPLFAQGAFNYSVGLVGSNNAMRGNPYVDPITSKVSRFIYPGDPVANNGAGSGWTQTASGKNPGDAKSLLSSGPFTLAQGDTQEVVWAYVIAQDTGRLSSVTKFKKYVAELHEYYKENFAPQVIPPPASGARLYTEKPGLNWKKRQIQQQAETLSTVLSNFGSDTLLVQLGTLKSPSYKVTAPAGNSLKILSGKSFAVKITFYPLQSGIILDTLRLSTNDSSYLSVSIPLSGEGVDIVPAVPGTLYAVEGTNLYTVNSSNGLAALKSQLPFAPANIAVNPVTKELIGLNNGLVRLSTGNLTFVPYNDPPYSIASMSKGMVYRNDTTVYFGGTGYIGRVNYVRSRVDTVAAFSTGFRVNGLARHPVSGTFWFSLLFQIYSGDTTNVLYTADPISKTIRRVGLTNFGKRVNDLAFDPAGRLYGLADTSASTMSYFIRIDTSTGAATVIGSTGIKNLKAMAFDPQSVLGVTAQNTMVPLEYSLKQNYPNPFNPTTNIEYSVPASAHVRLSVYDLLGKEVMNLVNEQHTAGNYSVSMDASRLASGIYMYRLTSGNFVETKKMVILK